MLYLIKCFFLICLASVEFAGSELVWAMCPFWPADHCPHSDFEFAGDVGFSAMLSCSGSIVFLSYQPRHFPSQLRLLNQIKKSPSLNQLFQHGRLEYLVSKEDLGFRLISLAISVTTLKFHIV